MRVKTIGHSALFMLVPNPGPGLGLLLAYWFFGKGEMKDAAPGMILIHFFGGIHEVYFPYVLSNPITLIGMIASGIVGTGTLTLLNVGTVATPSPGSIFSVIALSPPEGMLGVLLAVADSCLVSFLINAIFVKMQYKKNGKAAMVETVVAPELASSMPTTTKEEAGALTVDELDLRNINLIVVACDAGMGTSAMGAIVLQKKLEADGLNNVTVSHCAMTEIPEGSRYIVCPKEIAIQIADRHPIARIIPIDNFLDAPEYGQIVEEFVNARVNMNKNGNGEDYHGGMLLKKNIRLNLPSKTKEEVIRDLGNALVECGYVTPKYVDGMVAKEDVFNTCLGNLLALPHGIESVIGEIKNSGLAIFSYPDGVDWGEGQMVKLVIAVASAGDEHIETLGKIAGNCGSEEEVEEILKMSVDQIYELFA